MAMATRFEIVLPGTERDRLLAAAEEALDRVERLEAQLSIYRESSDVSEINSRAAREPVQVEPQLFALLRMARDVSMSTGGAFDPTVAPLLRCWGFIGGSGSMPAPEAVEEARAATGAHLLEFDEEQCSVRFRQEGVSLDLGAIGKGYAIDRALEALEDAGVTSALIHAGTSTIYGLGAPPGEDGWRVALRDPCGEPDDRLGEVRLRDRALSVSAPHGKAFREGDRLFGHVLDPRTGMPTHGALMAAVAHPSTTLTDALSTALLVLGEGGITRLSGRYPEADLLVVSGHEQGQRVSVAGPDSWRLVL